MRLPSFHRTAAAACAVAVFAFSSPARAFCRTITQDVPPSWDSHTHGCFKGDPSVPKGWPAKFLWWSTQCVGYSLQKDASRQVPLDQATEVAAQAFDVWAQAACATGHPSVHAVDSGPVECSEVRYNKDTDHEANQHVIVFRDAAWPHDDPNNTLGLTTMTFDTETGEIYDADMEINTAQHPISVGGSTGYDLATIMTHEAGHFYGIAHSELTTAIMYAQYQANATALTADDVEAICTIYTPEGKRNTTDGVVAEGACDSTPRHGFATTCDAPAIDPPVEKKGCTCVGAGAGGVGSGGGGVMAGLAMLGLAVMRRRRNA